jgi:hypothetical protein
MGSLRVREHRHLLARDCAFSAPGDHLWRPESESDEACAIGALPLRAPVPAMRIGHDGCGLIYLDEVPLYVGLVWRVLEDGGGHRHRWWRLEAKARDARVSPGTELVVAQHPYASGWTHRAPFKAPSKKGPDERPDLSASTYRALPEVFATLDRLRHDYWEKGNWLTAGISEPDLPFDPAQRVRNSQEGALLVFGLCERAAELEKSLWNDKAVRDLLRATELATIQFWCPKAKIKVAPKLLEEVKGEAVMLMMLSIRQALAGPHRDSETWLGRPITERISQIYRGHLNRRNRLLVRDQGRMDSYDDNVLYGREMDEDIFELPGSA